MKYPAKLKPGATIGLVCTSSAITEERKAQCIKVIENMGFRVKAADNISTDIGGFMAGTGEEKGYWLNSMFADPEIDAIFCIRGGDSGTRTWKYLDVETLKKNPKIFVGYSDVTTFHLILNQMCDLVTFHGPMVSSNMVDRFDEETAASFFKALNAEGRYLYENPEGFPIEVMKEGKAEGRLVGGNLTLLVTSMGTPYEFDCKGKILFIEEVHGHVDSMDRELIQLINSGKLDDAEGIILGQFTDCINHVKEEYDVIHLFRDLLADYDKPVMYNIQSGHGFPMMTLPMGAKCSMNTETKEIWFDTER